MRREEQRGLDGMPSRLYACTPTRLSTWLSCRRLYRMSYLDRPAPRKGPPWAHNSLGASVHNALAGWWRLPQGQRTVPAAAGLLDRGWINEGFASDAQAAAARDRARGLVEDYVAGLDPADEPAGGERTGGARTARTTFSGRIDRLADRPAAGAVRGGRGAGSAAGLPPGGAASPAHQDGARLGAHPGHAGPACGPGRGHRRRVRGRGPALP